MKHLNLLKSTLLLCALIVGSTSVWAVDVTINFGTTAGYWSAHSSDSYTDSDSRIWTRACSVSNMSGQAGYSQFGNASNTPTVTLIATAGSDMTVTAFSVTMKGASGDSKGTIYLYKKNGATETELATASVTSSSDVTCSIPSSQVFSSTDELEVKYVGTSKGIRVTQLSYSYTTSGGGSSVANPTFSPVAGAVASGTTVTISQAEADEIRYTTDGTAPTKTTGTVYSSPITITTATTIKAIAIKNDEVSSVVTAAYTISVTAPSFSLDGGSYLGGTTFTITSPGNTIYYTTDGSNPTLSSTEYTGPINITTGKITYKAIAYDTYGNSSSIISRTYTGITPTSLPFSWTGTTEKGKEDLAGQTGVVANLASDYAASNAPYRLKFDGTSKYVIVFTDESPVAVTFTAKIFEAASTGSKMKVQASSNGVDFTDIEEFTIKGAANETFEFTTTNEFTSTDRVIKIALSSKDKNVGVGSITISNTVSATISTAEYATFVSPYATDFSTTGVTVYTATAGETSVTLNEVASGKVPANTPVVLYKAGADGSVIDVPVVASADAVGSNDLKVSTGTDVADMYVLASKGSGVGFYKWSGTSDLSAGKVYLQGASSAREFLGFGDVTGIESLTPSPSPKGEGSEYYNLAGQRVAQPTKGLYIVNGKKVVLK